MKQIFAAPLPVDSGVATARKKYEKPVIQVIELDATPTLLTGSTVSRSFGAGFADDDDSESW